MNRTKTIVLWGILCLVLFAAGACQPQTKQEPNAPPLKLSLAVTPAASTALITIADQKGFFREAGLNVSVRIYPSGLACVEALCRGEAEMATAANMVFALRAFNDPSLRAVASIGMSRANEIVARRDRNITKPADLKGKRVGMSANTVGEYYLMAFLLMNSIPASEVAVVDIPPARIAQALIKGEVDAISSWDINVYRAKKGLGDSAVSWPTQNDLDWYLVLITRDDLAPSPQVKRFLQALLEAENFLLAHEEEAKSIIMRTWGFEPEFMREVWDKTRLNVSLPQSMVVSMENFAKWKMSKDNKPSRMPDYIDYIDTSALDELDPNTVTIFR